MSWPTTRRYPRTLAEAFPDERATWHDGWQRPVTHNWAGRALAIAIGISLALVLVEGLAS